MRNKRKFSIVEKNGEETHFWDTVFQFDNNKLLK